MIIRGKKKDDIRKTQSPEGGLNRDEELSARSLRAIGSIISGKPRSSLIWDLLLRDDEIRTCMEMAQYTTVGCMGMNDHGKVHAIIATSSALQILSLLIERSVEPDLVSSGIGEIDDAYLVVLTAAFCHDLGNLIHREDHISHSVTIARPILDRILPEVYSDPYSRYRIRSGILSAIYTHHGEPRPLTLEASVVCIGDATDMTTGRGRAAFEGGSITIHTVSALSIEQVTISAGKDRPVEIGIMMSNSAGIYQVQEILGPKIMAGQAGKFIEVTARLSCPPVSGEKRIVGGIQLIDGKSSPIPRE